ncbi:MAG: MarC family protein [Rhodobacteraceae bacterium]|nr:MarC family protein [Paracoccaceae bacterium]
MIETGFLISAFATLFVVIDPPGLVPLFIVLTQGISADHRRNLAKRACIIAAILLTLFGLLGEKLLGLIGISMPAFRITGGILLFITALDMLFERQSQRREEQKTDPDCDLSVFPLATPLIAGPGTIATIILLVGKTENWIATAFVIGLMLAAIFTTFLFLLAAPRLEHLLGRTGIVVINRLLGILLATLSVQFVIDGVKGAGLI